MEKGLLYNYHPPVTGLTHLKYRHTASTLLCYMTTKWL